MTDATLTGEGAGESNKPEEAYGSTGIGMKDPVIGIVLNQRPVCGAGVVIVISGASNMALSNDGLVSTKLIDSVGGVSKGITHRISDDEAGLIETSGDKSASSFIRFMCIRCITRGSEVVDVAAGVDLELLACQSSFPLPYPGHFKKIERTCEKGSS